MMKSACLLIAIGVTMGTTLQAQSTTKVEQSTNRITITTTTVDDQGKQVTETWIAEGEQPEMILKEMAVQPEILAKVEADKLEAGEKEERLFLFRHADGNVIEGKLQEGTTPVPNEFVKEIFVIREPGGKNKECKAYSYAHQDHHNTFVFAGEHDEKRKSNCAALGVYVNPVGTNSGCRINSLINQGGAQAAGMLEGDLITKIDEFDVNDFSTLHLALSHFQPGDIVTVRYDREGKSSKAKVELKDWADLPGHEWRSRPDCGNDEPVPDIEIDQTLQDDPAGGPSMQPLELEDARIYPNPTEGLFAFSFTTVPGPVSISITDVNGQVIYQEENENSTGFYNREIDLKEVPAGNYVVSVKQGDRVFTQQIAKQ
jgi:hypothetical protein